MSGRAQGGSPRWSSVHAAGAPSFSSAMVNTPSVMAWSPHRRKAVQNAVLHSRPQKRCGCRRDAARTRQQTEADERRSAWLPVAELLDGVRAAEEPMVRRLSGGGRWIRTNGTAARKARAVRLREGVMHRKRLHVVPHQPMRTRGNRAGEPGCTRPPFVVRCRGFRG